MVEYETIPVDTKFKKELDTSYHELRGQRKVKSYTEFIRILFDCWKKNNIQQTRSKSVQGGEGQSNTQCSRVSAMQLDEGKQGKGNHKPELTSPADIKNIKED